MTALPKEILDAIKNPGNDIDAAWEGFELQHGPNEKRGIRWSYQKRMDAVGIEMTDPNDASFIRYTPYKDFMEVVEEIKKRRACRKK